jgi:hypothetical protein
MIKPVELPSFATDATLTGGPQIGSVARLRPSNALLAQGFYQGRRLPGRMIAWLFGTIGDWLKYLAPVQIKNWKLEGQDFLGATTNHASVIWLPELSQTPVTGQWFIFNSTPSPATGLVRYPAFVPTIVDSLSGPTLDTWKQCAANTSGSILVAVGTLAGAGKTYASGNRGTTWTGGGAVNLTSAEITYSPVSSLFIAGGATDGQIVTSPDGITWTSRGIPTGVNAQYFFIKEAGGVVLACDANGHLTHSNDGGLTWSVATASPIANTFDAAYTSQFGWCLLGASQVAFSVNLIAWTASTPLSGNVGNSIASDGVSRYALAVSGSQSGVVFTDDGGTTWELVRFSTEVSPPSFLPSAIRYNGFQWAVLGKPTTATVHYSFHTTLRL